MGKKKLKKWQIVLIVLLAIGIIGAAVGGGDKDTPKKDDPKVEDTGKKEEPKDETEPEVEISAGQKNALRSGKNYLNTMAFSYTGLIKQLEFEKYSTEDATYAADNCGADWNEQASKAAKNYLDTMSFSRQGLIDQLLFEGYTQEQAEYGATDAGY